MGDESEKKEETKPKSKKFYRSRKDRIFGGVAGGLAEYFDTDIILMRLAFVVIAVLSGIGPMIIVYILAMIFVPNEGDDKDKSSKERINEFAEEFKEGTHTVVSGIKKHKDAIDNEHKGRNFWGFLFIAIGLIALLSRFSSLMWFPWKFFWPIIVILVGLYIIFRKK